MQEENLQAEQGGAIEEETSVSENVAMVEENAKDEAVPAPVAEIAGATEDVTTEGLATAEQEPLNHVIQAGETLISISKMYYGDDSKVQAICELNGITNSDNIQVGQKIILP